VPCDAKMYHMKRASVRDLRYDFPKVERMLAEGEAIEITKRKQVIAKLVPAGAENQPRHVPDFLGRMKKIYGDKVLKTSWADLLAERKGRY
jgi:antitoxin (DNA-binding transcriptional repressor) of toxin-antitoxin stability system